MRLTEEALTFDDVLLVPAHSQVLPKEVDLTTNLTASIKLNIPLLSAAMDTVTEARTAICMAREGGLGIVHKNMTPDEQAVEIDQVHSLVCTDQDVPGVKVRVDQAVVVGVGQGLGEQVVAGGHQRRGAHVLGVVFQGNGKVSRVGDHHVGLDDLLGDQPICSVVVRDPQQRFGQTHQGDPLRIGQAELDRLLRIHGTGCEFVPSTASDPQPIAHAS